MRPSVAAYFHSGMKLRPWTTDRPRTPACHAPLWRTTVTQIRGLAVATLAPFAHSRSTPCNNHANLWPRCRHACTVCSSSIRPCNCHADSWPRCRHARTVCGLLRPCNRHKHPAPSASLPPRSHRLRSADPPVHQSRRFEAPRRHVRPCRSRQGPSRPLPGPRGHA